MCWCWERLGLCCWIPDGCTQGEQITFSVVFTSLPLFHVSSAGSLISPPSGELAALVISSSPQSMQTCCPHLLSDSFKNQMFFFTKKEKVKGILRMLLHYTLDGRRQGTCPKLLSFIPSASWCMNLIIGKFSRYQAVKHDLWKVPLSESYNLKVTFQ